MIKKTIILIVLMVLLFPILVFSQPSNLTDREVLIQMYEKVNHIQETTEDIYNNSKETENKLIQIEGRVIKNEVEIDSFLGRVKELCTRWNLLLTIFATFVLGILGWMWKSVSYRKHNNKIKPVNN